MYTPLEQYHAEPAAGHHHPPLPLSGQAASLATASTFSSLSLPHRNRTLPFVSYSTHLRRSFSFSSLNTSDNRRLARLFRVLSLLGLISTVHPPAGVGTSKSTSVSLSFFSASASELELGFPSNDSTTFTTSISFMLSTSRTVLSVATSLGAINFFTNPLSPASSAGIPHTTPPAISLNRNSTAIMTTRKPLIKHSPSPNPLLASCCFTYMFLGIKHWMYPHPVGGSLCSRSSPPTPCCSRDISPSPATLLHSSNEWLILLLGLCGSRIQYMQYISFRPSSCCSSASHCPRRSRIPFSSVYLVSSLILS